MTVNLVQDGITAVLDGSPTTSQLNDLSFFIHDTTSAGVTLSSYTPAQAGSGTLLRNGASLNRSGYDTVNTPAQAGQPYDGREVYSGAYALTLPVTLYPGDQVIIAKSSAAHGSTQHGFGIDRTSYFDTLGDSVTDYMMSITSVNYAAQAGQMRFGGLGNHPDTRVLRRAFEILETDVDVSKLPSVIDLATLGVTPPAWSFVEDIFERFCGGVDAIWGARYVCPNFQNPGYGRDFMAAVSLAAIYLCSTESTATKQTLARRMVRWGLDYAGAWMDGRKSTRLGGNSGGERFLIVLAGHLLNIAELESPDLRWPSELVGDRFAETHRIRPFDADPSTDQDDRFWWFSEAGQWDLRWDAFGPDPTTGEASGNFLRQNPSTWTKIAQYANASEEYRLTGYLAHVEGAQKGVRLATKLMGLTTSMGADWMRFGELFQAGPGASAIAELAAQTPALGNIPWGAEYPCPGSAAWGLVDAAWTSYYP